MVFGHFGKLVVHIFASVLVYFIKKNLATLIAHPFFTATVPLTVDAISGISKK
jgi:hypothetical protein